MLCQVLVKSAIPSRALTLQYRIVLVNITLAAQWALAHLAHFVGLAIKAPTGVRLLLRPSLINGFSQAAAETRYEVLAVRG